eukprot:15042833-Alexandrium_andersonii.AAC.1
MLFMPSGVAATRDRTSRAVGTRPEAWRPRGVPLPVEAVEWEQESDKSKDTWWERHWPRTS